jgi:hypothetical protein
MSKAGLNVLVLLAAAVITYGLGTRDSTARTAETIADGVPYPVSDFETADGRSSLGSRWAPFTDRVLGGTSSARLTIVPDPDGTASRVLHIEGEATTAYGFGFSGASLDWPVRGRLGLDGASGFRGLRFRTRGDGRFYSIKLVTSDVGDYDYLTHHFEAPRTWTPVEAAFSTFRQMGFGRRAAWAPSNLIGLQVTTFCVPPRDYRFELYIDDLELVR